MRRYVDSLDPVADDEEITAKVSNVLFADPFFAHTVYLVTFARQIAVPAIAKVLYRSGNGDIVTKPRSRNNDTIVYFTEFYRRGYRSEEGRAAIAMMEQIHSRFRIDETLKMYTMATVMLEPDRLAQHFGADPFSEIDKQARWHFWKGLAREMGFELPAETRSSFVEWMVDFERNHYACTKDGVGCYSGLVEDWLRWYPGFLPARERLARQSLAALLDDPLRAAMGEPRPPIWVRAQVGLVAKTYMHSTPLRVFRKDRSLVDFFGVKHDDPRSLEGVGHAPPAKRS